MRRTIQLASQIFGLAFVLGAALLAPTIAARAEVTVTFNPGGIAYGYNDGYWDRDHAWHAWPDRRAAEDYRSHDAQHYDDRKHDADKDGGWRGDNWWKHH
ncbi:MAG TPA: hypothetical protein VNF99_00940 [Stellaceae bacterium]|nr:hypothetical protein [Stellaceae bacterium]